MIEEKAKRISELSEIKFDKACKAPSSSSPKLTPYADKTRNTYEGRSCKSLNSLSIKYMDQKL